MISINRPPKNAQWHGDRSIDYFYQGDRKPSEKGGSPTRGGAKRPMISGNTKTGKYEKKPAETRAFSFHGPTSPEKESRQRRRGPRLQGSLHGFKKSKKKLKKGDRERPDSSKSHPCIPRALRSKAKGTTSHKKFRDLGCAHRKD